jgi:hypothetical protein
LQGRDVSRAKQKGTLAETAVVRYLRERGLDVHRQVLTGARDQGDVRGLGVACEIKNCATVSMPAWLREAHAEAVNAGLPIGVVVHHPRGQGQVEGWHVTLTLEDFATLMQRVTWPSTPHGVS